MNANLIKKKSGIWYEDKENKQDGPYMVGECPNCRCRLELFPNKPRDDESPDWSIYSLVENL